jgi:HSP20 family protein
VVAASTAGEEEIMSKNKMLTPMVEQWPAWFGRLGFPESWQQFLDAETIRVEEFRDGDTMVVRAELPGIDPDKDVEVVVADGMLRLHAERTQRINGAKDESGDAAKGAEQVRSEFRYGAFTRMLPLPVGASQTDVTATYADGILEVRVPMAGEGDRSRKIAVTRG